MPFSRPIRSVTNCPSTTSDERCGSDWTSAGRVRWPTAQTELAAFPTQHRRGGALMLGDGGGGQGVLCVILKEGRRARTPSDFAEVS